MSNQEKIKLVGDHLLKKWYFLVLAIIVGAGLGYLRLMTKPPVYSANISFVLSTEARPNAGMVNLASQLGFDGITSNPDNIFSGDNIIELFKSRTLIGRALVSEVDTTRHITLLNLIARKQFQDRYTSLGPFGNNPD